ncbi:uncharacterized protein N7483_008897 [Penicillium malachiteum]|uniref:uncharacterized protein n=1 Tax=Penicillium malachiteum TaxID=1324776 RepID=UPI002548ED00|nr:uncharacterized protein N7483_008897 [Penicillium malachiteum]KAJ5720963.1 hypothetical protein N7483_008897 [Penicillium malachiteum]
MVKLLWQAWPSGMPAPTKPSLLLEHKVANMRWSMSRYPLCVALYPHILRLKQMWSQVADCSDSTKVRFAALLTDAAWYQHEKGRFRGFDGFFDLSQTICESLPGDDSDSVLSTFLNMQKSICESVDPGFVDMRLGNAYTEMALSLTQAGQLYEAIRFFRREMEIRKRIGITHLQSRDANYAMTLMLRGDLKVAEKVLLDCVKLWESTGSVVTLRIARHFQALGNLRNLQG